MIWLCTLVYIQPDGIGIPGGCIRPREHTYIHTYIGACKFIRLYAFTLWNNTPRVRPDISPPSTLPSVNFSFISSIAPFPTLLMQMVRSLPGPLLFFFSFFFFFFILFSYTGFSFLSYSPVIISTLPRASFLHVVISLLPVILFFVFWSQSVVENVSDGMHLTRLESFRINSQRYFK